MYNTMYEKSGFHMTAYKGNENGGGLYDYFFITDKQRKTNDFCMQVFEAYKKNRKGYLIPYGNDLIESIRYCLHKGTLEKNIRLDDDVIFYDIRCKDSMHFNLSDDDVVICKL